jgi:serine/threonine protein kinase
LTIFVRPRLLPRVTTGQSAKTDPLVGATLGDRFRVIRKIAEGGMGAVYEAVQLNLERKVAVKVLHAHLAGDAEIVQRFEREARATTAIGHPNIVDVVDVGELDDGSRYLVLEYLDGRDLARALKDDGPLPLGRAVRILSQVADGVGAAHAKGIVHRDLKPENVFLVGASEHVKIVDFGVSKFRDAAAGPDSKTRTGTALGTPYYMSPEQAQGLKDVDHRADVYALGVILFRVLSGHHPFDDTSYPMLIVKICTEDAPPLGAWRSDLPPALESLVVRMLEKDPSKRPQSMAEVKDALALYASHTGAPALTGAAGPSTASPRLLSRTPRDHSPDAFGQTMQSQPTRPALSREDREEEHEMDKEEAKIGGTSRAPMIALAGLFGVLAISAAGYAIWGVSPDAPTEVAEENAPLPEPHEATTHALAAGTAGTSGWSWLNPRPRAMPTWFATDVAGPGLVALVGQDGVAARFMDGLLVTWRTGTTAQLNAVRWAGPDQALAAGDGGVLLRLTETGPRALDSGTTASLRGLAVISATDAIAVGDDGTVLRLVGDRTTELDVGVTGDLLAAHERHDEAFVVGESGVILRITDLRTGHFVREQSRYQATLRAVGGCERGSLYAAGDEGLVLRRHAHTDGTGEWRGLRLPHDTHEAFVSIACDHGRAAIVGANGSVLLASGDDSVVLPSGTENAWHGISGADDESTWLVGGGGQLASIEVDHVQTRVDGPTFPLRDIATIGGAVVAVGEWGHIVREHEDGFREGESPTDGGLAALTAVDAASPEDAGRLIAVGDLGTIVEVRFDGATLLTSPSHASFRDIVSADGHVLIVGTEGVLLRGDIGAFAPTRLEEAGDLWSLDGTPDDALVVGDAGFVAQVTATGHERIPCDVTASLRSVLRVGEVAYAVGEHGTAVRISGASCIVEHDGGPTLNAVGLGPHGRPLAVGDEGVSLERSDAGAWELSDLDAGRASLRGIERIERYVYVVGTGGALLRRIVVDGS